MKVAVLGDFRLKTGLLAGLLFSLLITPSAMAATEARTSPESITLSPTSKHYNLAAGETITDRLTVVNDGTVGYNFRVYAAPYSVKDKTYDPDFTTVRTNTDVERWVVFERDSYYAKPGETVIVNYTLRVPKNATPGGHYGVLFAETDPSGSTDTTGVQRKKRVGAILYATVKGDYVTGGKLLELTVPKLQFKAPLKASSTVENNGNADFAVDTTMKVTDLFGSKKFETTKDYQVLPKTSRQINMEWPQSPGLGLYKVSMAVKFLDQNESRSSYVLMAPVWLYLVAVMAVLVGIIYLVQKRR